MGTKKTIFSIERGAGRNKVLIIGGENFLGASFAKKFAEKGVKPIYGWDWRSKGTPTFDEVLFIFKQDELKDFLQEPGKFDEFQFLGQNLKTKFLFLAPISNFSKLVNKRWQEFLGKTAINGRLVFFTDLYGPGMDLNEETPFNSFLRRALRGELKVLGEGLERCQPTFVDDFIKGALRATFFQGTRGRIFYLINPVELTMLDLAYLLEKILPEKTKIEFVPGEEKKRERWPKELLIESVKELNWKAKTDLRQGLRETINWYRENRKTEKPRKGRTEKLKKLKGGKRLFFKFLIASLLLLILLFPFFRLGWHLAWGVRDLKKASEWLTTGDFERAERKVTASGNHLMAVKNQLNNSRTLALLPFGDDLYQGEKLVEVGIDFCQAMGHLILAGKPLKDVWQFVFSEEKTGMNLSESLGQSSQELKAAYEELSFVEGNLGNFRSSKLKKLPGVKRLFLWEKELPEMRRKIAWAYPLLLTLDKVLGVEGKKVYLILFQNNMELRPTGGFIGSYGLLTFEKGKFEGLEVEDAYTADGQLKGHVEPPRPIRVYLNEASWYFRDSNWKADFYQSALDAAWFLEKEMEIEVNGVIGINLLAVENILEKTGPIWLADDKEEISKDNLFLKAESRAEKDFFPGSTQKKDFLGSLARQLFEKVKSGGVAEGMGLVQAVWQSLEGRQILVSLDEKEAMVLMNSYGWDGDLKKVSCDLILGDEEQGADCLADYTFFVEANLGVNKANYFLKREVREEVKIKEVRVERTLNLFYENTSLNNLWPGGDYKNYLRVIIPGEAVFSKAAIDDIPVEEKAIDKEIIGDKESYGFLVMVPGGEKRKVSFKYNLPLSSFQQKFIYLLSIQKQSGMGAEPLELTVFYPASWQMRETEPSGLTERQSIMYNTDLSKDRLIKIEFEKE